MINGQGTFTYAIGDKYVGEYKDNMINGQGTFTSANGFKYVGEWMNNMMHGQGTITSKDGRIVKGLFETGEFVGE